MSQNTPYSPHFRAIRSVVAALVFAVLSVPTVLRGENFGFWFGIIAILLVVYSFVPITVNE